jgi:hypothetical protein
MHKPGWERVIGVLNTASGAEVKDLPFDIRQRRIITFVLSEDADNATRKAVQTKLAKDLKDALRINLKHRSEQMSIVRVPAKADNPSIWCRLATPSSIMTPSAAQDATRLAYRRPSIVYEGHSFRLENSSSLDGQR